MAVLPILTGADNPALRIKTKRVPKITKDLLKLIKDMEATVEKVEGLGLAAPQVGQTHKVCIARLGGKLVPLINPDIIWKSKEQEEGEEGCLSLPGVWLSVPRAVSIVVRYLNAKGEEQERKLQELPARIVQHEVDHLNGVLIVDYR